MKGRGYHRFVAVFAGIMLAIGVFAAVMTGDETLIGMCAAVAIAYAFYMYLFIRKEKELREQNPKQKKSPLMKR